MSLYITLFEEKKCRICKKTKPLSEFYPHKTNKDHHRGECITCSRIYQKQSNIPRAIKQLKQKHKEKNQL